VFPIAEKCNIILRLFSALGATGVDRVLVMPDAGGVSERLRRFLSLPTHRLDSWPEVEFLEMPVEEGPSDTVCAVEQMVKAGVGAIVVLGGDGTHRLVAGVCGETPVMALSTGTNNVFPEIREATVAGIATGLVAAGRVCRDKATRRNKRLQVEVNGVPSGLAVVDISISNDSWTGAKALWRPEMLSQLFVTFAEPDAIGLSSIAGLLQPVSREARHGLRVDIGPIHAAKLVLKAPLAPGLIVPVGVMSFGEIYLGEPKRVRIQRGVIGLDGEREIEFQPDQSVVVRLDSAGPFTIDTERVMAMAAQNGLLLDGRQKAVLAETKTETSSPW
jgi:predicted polyphosphate/ATP-dependent NAD kinase